MSHNTWIHRIVRVGIRPLAKTRITPNQLTSVRLGVAVWAAALMAIGPRWHIYGAGLFFLSMLLDRADGELARFTGRTSPWGHTYDLFSDALANTLIFVGIGIGLRAEAFGLWSIPMGILAGAGVVFIFWLVLRIESVAGKRAAEFNSRGGFDPDDAMLAIPVAVIMGWTDQLLIAAGVGAPVFALFMLWRGREKLWPSQGKSQ
jgi:archaetidylinositol phosphate synthase